MRCGHPRTEATRQEIDAVIYQVTSCMDCREVLDHQPMKHTGHLADPPPTAELEIQRRAAEAKAVEVQLEADVAAARGRLASHRATAPAVASNPVHAGFAVERGPTPGHPPPLIVDRSVRCEKHGGVLAACTGKLQGAANKCDNSRWGEALMRCDGPCFCVSCHDWPADKR